MNFQPKCLLCEEPLLNGPLLRLGELPPCNRFEALAQTDRALYPLSLQACQSCALIQLLEVPPLAALVPRLPWLRYNEPDAHLEAVSAKLLKLMKKDGRVYSVGPFDQPLLKHLQAGGLHCEGLDLLAVEPVAQENYFPYLETLQARLQPNFLKQLAREKGQGDLVVCRYLLEHCRDPLAALAGLRALITENGFALLEVPDSTKFLAKKDYSFIWEEHVCYFTENTLLKLLRQGGYKLIDLLRFEGQLEDALVAVVQPSAQFSLIDNSLSLSESIHSTVSFPRKREFLAQDKQLPAFAGMTMAELDEQSRLFASYAAAFSKIREDYQKALASIKARGGKVAIFGAGHQAIMFINALGLQANIFCLIDDDANKQNYLSPGASLPILPSSVLLEDTALDTCLLALSPRLETKIQEKFAPFLRRGGKMYSIFPGSGMKSLLEETTNIRKQYC